MRTNRGMKKFLQAGSGCECNPELYTDSGVWNLWSGGRDPVDTGHNQCGASICIQGSERKWTAGVEKCYISCENDSEIDRIGGSRL